MFLKINVMQVQPNTWYQLVGKRWLDLIVAAFALSLLSPVLLVLYLVIASVDGRPVLFRQKRVGRHRSHFRIFKFRTMLVRETASEFEVGNQSTVTRLGRFLRRTKLDELPQLVNVLLGDMSLVGPRPEVEQWTMVYRERWDRVLSVRPGITDRAALAFHDEEQLLAKAGNPEVTYRNTVLPQKLNYYEKYVGNISMLDDLSILAETAFRLSASRQSTAADHDIE